jgi:hypothetical protein
MLSRGEAAVGITRGRRLRRRKEGGTMEMQIEPGKKTKDEKVSLQLFVFVLLMMVSSNF